MTLKDDGLNFGLEIRCRLTTWRFFTSIYWIGFSHQLLGNPNAQDLMKIVTTVGLAKITGAVRSLVTTGIQKGHMKMHLLNILNQLKGATEEGQEKSNFIFRDKVVSHRDVVDEFCNLRGIGTNLKLIRFLKSFHANGKLRITGSVNS